jgi:hypothetical protein
MWLDDFPTRGVATACFALFAGEMVASPMATFASGGSAGLVSW